MSYGPFKDESDFQAYLQRARRGFRPDPGETGAGTGHAEPPTKPKPRMNKWEEAYAYNLDLQKVAGLIKAWVFEPWKFILADGVTYRPDFLVVPWLNAPLQIHEVKGFMREDARVKLLTTARLHPWFEFYKVQKDGSGWLVERVEG